MPETRPQSGASFPQTRLSIVHAARDADAEVRRAAFERLVAAYWRPVYGRCRLKWRVQPADAEDLTQEFFARALERSFFDAYDPSRARFRTFIRTCLDRFVANATRDGRRLKRGGGITLESLGFADAERALADDSLRSAETDPDGWFDREWVRGLFDDAVEELRAETAGTLREIRFRVLERHDLLPVGRADRPSYRALAEELDLTVTQVTNHLAWARRELRRLIIERLRVLSGSDAELREEAESLFGAPLP